MPKMPKVMVRLRRADFKVISALKPARVTSNQKKLKSAAPKAHSLTLGTLIYFSSF